MSANTLLWCLLGLSVFVNLVGAMTVGRNEQITRDVRVAERAAFSWWLIGLSIIARLAMLALWIWFSIAVRDWRFAVISGLGTVISFTAQLTVGRDDRAKQAGVPS